MRRAVSCAVLLCLLLVSSLGVGCCKQEPKPVPAAEPAAGKVEGESATPGPAQGEQTPLDKRRIAMVVAPEGYQDREFEVPRELFDKAGFAVDVVSLYEGEALGALGGKVKVDLTLDQAVERAGDFAAVVFVGGPGSAIYHENKVAHKFAQEAAGRKTVVAAICLAPFILAQAHVLDGLEATAWTGGKFTEGSFAGFGPLFRAGPVVTDGRFVTANGPKAAEEFARQVLELLNSR